MQLTVKHIAELLDIPERAVYDLIRKKQIPCFHIHNQYKFNRSEIKEWVLARGIKVSNKLLLLDDSMQSISVEELITRGGIYYDVPGETPQEAIKNAVHVISLPPEVNRDEVVFSLLEREEMMTTGIGRGVAIPHPRSPVIANAEHESIALCFLKKAIDFKALDNEPVHVLCVVLSTKPERHVGILARLAFLFQQDDFIALLKRRESPGVICGYIRQKETSQH